MSTYNTTQHKATQHKATQHKATQHNTTQHNTRQGNTRQHKANTLLTIGQLSKFVTFFKSANARL